ncbi:chromosome segregation protein SMC [Bacillus carboniphilus]|uniref:Chromosome partition protein Smc n=1 Tax=Bacillus carboniphilus TaxID=86663 RepID=A0ABN0WB81_9BACI
MFLKRLESVGFKSFAERISVDFVPGVTAVVGPNGSGKSNITDSIRWVLGEQSAKSLRGSKMEDIIFAGSDSRKALNFAEVTLTLDNHDQALPLDFEEVSVTRRVYRSGESDFFINKQACRLKDIVELFMDSGLGREAFSIISQGRVEEILNSKSEERRSIFEEAAGVLKYKTRKKKAEGKLEETEANLHRVQDILHELEGQIEPLRIQASIAKDYLEQKEQLETIEVAVLVYEIEDLHRRWEQLTKDLKEHKEKELEYSQALSNKEATAEQLRNQVAAIDESVQDLQQILLKTSEELEKLEGRKEVMKERLKNSESNQAQLKKNIEELQARKEVLASQLSTFEDQYKQEKSRQKEIQDNLATKEAQLQYVDVSIEDQIEALKSEYIEWLNEEARKKNEYEYIQEQKSQIGQKSNKLLNENQVWIEQRDTLRQQREEKEVQYNQLKEQTDYLREKLHEAETKLQTMTSQYEKQEQSLYKAYQYLQQAKSRKDMLEEMENDYAGFFQGVKEVLKSRDRLTGIHGAVAELISVEKQYEVAVETALGGALQNIVVETEQDARKAIQFLKSNAYGRATFLPVSVMKEREVAGHYLQRVSQHPQFVGVASDIVSFNPKFSAVIKNLLGNVLVTNDLKSANDIARTVDFRFRIVTLEGDVVNPGGSMTGGATRQKTSSVLSRKQELDELTEKLQVMEEKTLKLENHVKQMKSEMERLNQEIRSMRQQNEELREVEQDMKSQVKEIELNEKNIQDKLTMFDIETKQYGDDADRLDSREKALKEELVSIKEKISELNQQIEHMTAEKKNAQVTKETLQDEIGELKVLLASKKEQVQNLKQQLDGVQSESLQVEDRLSEVKEELQFLTSEMEKTTTGESDLDIQAKEKAVQKEETMQLISARRNQRVGLYEQLETLELEIKELRRLYKGMSEHVKDEEVKVNRLDVELESRLQQLQEEYMLTFEAAKEDYPLQLPIEEAKKKVKLTKKAIEELGTVNLGSIEEYDRVSERFEFLSEQKTDLESAKETLFEVIGEMDDEMTKRFSHTFYQIQGQFNSVFQALFGGGRADLRLTNPEDLLNTGVDIVAQPPGKKLQNLGLLSGGERALTAIALLFSILKVRPVPFCVLDEVEAALDDANVFRFSQYLKEFSKVTQFIVITHRKGTMEGADVLYGVTMQESGVSKLVSVRLEDSKELVTS